MRPGSAPRLSYVTLFTLSLSQSASEFVERYLESLELQQQYTTRYGASEQLRAALGPLSPSLWWHAMRHLDDRALCSLARSCKAFYRLVRAPSFWYSRLETLVCAGANASLVHDSTRRFCVDWLHRYRTRYAQQVRALAQQRQEHCTEQLVQLVSLRDERLCERGTFSELRRPAWPTRPSLMATQFAGTEESEVC